MTAVNLEPAPPVAGRAQDDASSGTKELAASALLASLAACGGGGGADSPVAGTPGGGQASTPAPAVAPVPPPITDPDASRFLAQAGFAASLADIESVKRDGYAAWLDRQFALPRDTLSNYQWMIDHGYAASEYLYGWSGVDNTLWRNWLSAPDPLRQRVVLALSEIFVIGLQGLPVAWPALMIASYVDMLGEKAFGSFRSLIEGVALSCGMGVYLDMLNNRRADARTGRMPDENFAREFMQLMTIGLVKLNLDGTPALDAAGQPVPTYDQTDITHLAAIFTGWTYQGQSNTDPSYVLAPMANNAGNFSTGAKQVLDVAIPASADGPAAMQIVLDTLAKHPNVGPFIGRQLIQRLVCSNPSPAYVKRVALVFNDNGAGQRGDLKAVLKAILLDPQARSPGSSADSGRLREPVMRFLQWGRTFKAASGTGMWTVGDTSNPANRLGQCPLRSPSVFNFFRPGYVPPNSELGAHGVTAPEFQLCNESTVAGYLNFMQAVIANGIGDVTPDYAPQLALAGDAGALVAQVALLLSGGTLSPATQAAMVTAVASIGGATEAGRLNRVQAAILLVMGCPEYQIQK